MNIGNLRRTFSAVRFAMNDIGLWRIRKKPIDEILSLLPAVHGVWPQSGDGVQLFAACDPLYFDEHVSGLITSINVNSPGASLHLHLYNPTEKLFGELERFQRNMSAVHLTWTWENVRIDEMHRRWKNIHLASLRFPRLYMALNASARPILSIDIDCFVRRNLNMFMDEARGADIGLVLRPEFRDPGKRVLALAVYTAPTATGISMLGAAASRIAAHLAGRWATEKLDQRCLSMAFEAYKDRMNFWPIPRSLADTDFNESSAIWTGKGGRKESDQYLRELKAITAQNQGTTVYPR